MVPMFMLPLALAALSPAELSHRDMLPTERNSAEISAMIDDVYRRFAAAYRDLDPAAIDDIYIEECIYLPGSPKAGIQPCNEAMAGFAQMFETARSEGRRLRIEFRIPRRRIYPGVVIDGGYYRLTSSDRAEPLYGKFIVVSELSADGHIRFVTDGFSPAPAKEFERLENVPILSAGGR